MRYIFIVCLSLLFVGCSVTKVPLTEYKIDVDMIQKDLDVKQCQSKSLKVSQSFSSIKLKTLNMNYTQGRSKIYTYSQSIWNQSPNEAITSEVTKMLRDKNIFKTVQISKSRVKSDLILEITIDKFIQTFDDELKNSYADIAINFTIIDAKTNTVISSKSFKDKEKTDTLDAMGGVEALNKALSKILGDSVDWFEEVCR